MLLAEQLAARARRWRGEAFNFSNEIQVTVLELVAADPRADGRATLEPDVRNEACNEIRHQYLSAARRGAMLGW